MRRLGAFVVFAPRYERSAEGLGAAEQDLVRRTATHAAYANQPHISARWQGYIDHQAAAVEMQRAIVESLRNTIAGSAANSRAMPEAVGGKRSGTKA